MLFNRMNQLTRFLLCAMAVSFTLSMNLGLIAHAGTFPDVSLIEESLKRGVATTEDVRRLLGTPDGFGSAIWPPDHRFFRVWYYEDMEVVGMQSAEGGVQEIDMRQQLMMIFFYEDRYDGFSWTSNVIPAEAR